MKVLFACSEAYPFIKTGGLADVAGSLPRALAQLGCQVRLLLPAYPQVLEKAQALGCREIFRGAFLGENLSLWQTRLPGSRVQVWLVDTIGFSNRAGNPYTGPDGCDWPDSAQRFYRFCQVAAALAQDHFGLGWCPQVVHANDWQTGLIAPLLADSSPRPRCIFTIHNLAYRGLFSRQTYAELGLPWSWWHMDGLEFYDQLAFIKGGLVWADHITTVSPRYAEEIQQPAFGHGLEGLLYKRRHQLSGIVNGIDTEEWNPGSDKHLVAPFNRRTLKRKALNKTALQERMGLPPTDSLPLLGFIGRLVEQKGIGLLLAVLPDLLARGACQFVALGSGEARYENALRTLAEQFPGAVGIQLGYDEPLAHQIEAGCDLFLMPSLFEPCGLNQLYSQRYGTPPLAHYVGGLCDTIIHLSDALGGDGQISDETGFLFSGQTPQALADKLDFALACYADKPLWRQLQINGMSQDFSWKKSASAYLELYHSA